MLHYGIAFPFFYYLGLVQARCRINVIMSKYEGLEIDPMFSLSNSSFTVGLPLKSIGFKYHRCPFFIAPINSSLFLCST